MLLRFKLSTSILCLLLFVSSCSVQSPFRVSKAQDEITRQEAIKKLNRFSVDTIDIDYISSCKARITTVQSSFSGSCQLILTRKKELQLTVLHSLGALLLKLYVDHQLIQVNDFTEKKSYRFDPDQKPHILVPIIADLTLDELQAILWGRITTVAGRSLEYEIEEDKPTRIVKVANGLQLEVVYRRWLEYNQQQFPALIEISNHTDGSSLKLAITHFEPGFINQRLTLDPLFINTPPDRSF